MVRTNSPGDSIALTRTASWCWHAVSLLSHSSPCGSSSPRCLPACSFGWEYKNDCEVDLAIILDEMPKTREPIFYDAFLRTGVDALYPVPVKVTNFDESAGNSPDSGGCVACIARPPPCLFFLVMPMFRDEADACFVLLRALAQTSRTVFLEGRL